MKRTPLVSVIMPVFNVASYLGEAIESVLAQTFTDFEFLILDDGSEDGSLKIAMSFSDERIRVLSGPHRGLVAMRNAGIAEARGKYIAWMDSDDVSHPDRLNKQFAFMESHPNVVMVGTWARLIDVNGIPLGVCAMPPTMGRTLQIALCNSNQFTNGSTLMLRTAVCAVGGYRPQFLVAEDYDLALRLSEIGYLANRAEVLYQLRVHPTSTTATIGSVEVALYAARAQKYALQRYLYGRDHIGYEVPRAAINVAGHSYGSTLAAAMDEVARSDWVQIMIWQARIRLALHVLIAPVTRPRRTFAWSIVLPHSLTTVYLRGVFMAFRRGSWRVAGRAKVQRVYRGMLERFNA